MHLQSQRLALHHRWQSIVGIAFIVIKIPIIVSFFVIGILVQIFIAVWAAETCNKSQGTISTPSNAIRHLADVIELLS